MTTSTLSSSRPLLFALSLAAACSVGACFNSVTNDGDDASGVDAAELKGAKKTAIAIFFKDLPPLGGGASGSAVSAASSGSGWGTGGAGGWEGSSTVATSSVVGGGWEGTTTSVSVGGGGGCTPPAESAVSSSGAGGAPTTGTGTTSSVSVGGGWEDTTSSVSVGGGCEETSSSSGGGTVDPNTLYLIAGSGAAVCANPFGINGCGGWQISIGLPPSLQHKGTIPLTPSLLGSASELGPDEGDGNCWFSGGSLLGGTLTILKINKKHVTFRLDGTSSLFSNAHADGTYDADLCGR